MTPETPQLKRHHWLILGVTYLISRLINLTKLPVFADEAIYIRWAQLIRQDPQQYLFFPMLDGKPPLHMWLLRFFLELHPLDPLWSSRVMSVLIGLGTLIVLVKITQVLSGSRKAQLATAITYLIFPFTFFHDRMGLIDPLLTLFLALTFLGLLKISQSRHHRWVIITGLAWGAALLTKSPAVFFTPVILLAIIWQHGKPKIKQLIPFAISFGIGLGMLWLLSLTEVFPYLFRRSSDFTYSISQLLAGEWPVFFKNFIKVSYWLTWYFAGATIIPIISLIKQSNTKPNRHRILWLISAAFVFMLPLLVIGKVLYPRYFLPVIIFLIPAISLAVDPYLKRINTKSFTISTTTLAGIVFASLYFMATLIFNPAHTPFVPIDQPQYLTSWSAGYGITKARDFIKLKAQDHPVTVATEGYFGTLPDGFIMYFDRDSVIQNLAIFGIGQPVTRIPEEVQEKALTTDTYLLVNQNRLHMEANQINNCCQIIQRYPRPLDGADLLLLQIKPDEK